MRTISEQELKDILSKHDEWLKDSTKGQRADLRSANLRSANLIVFQFQQSWAYFTFDGTLRIGCECMPITEWMLGYEQVGRKHGYTELQIEMYGAFIKQCHDAFKDGKFNQPNNESAEAVE